MQTRLDVFRAGEIGPELPLGRYLPPLGVEAGVSWAQEQAGAGEWVLDPFGAAPGLAVAVAHHGRRVLVAANNPILRFVLDVMADSPGAAGFQAGLAALAAAYKGSERLELFLRGLYRSECGRCGAALEVEAFLWEREARAPYGKLITCPACGARGEQEASQPDIAAAQEWSRGGLHRARALERVVAANDPDRPLVEEALAVYPPRALMALFTLINKLPGVEDEHCKAITALLLAACDAASTLWPYPVGRARPRQLTVPPRYRENNLWRALEEAARAWGAWEGPRLPVTLWPELPPAAGGVCLFEGRLKALTEKERLPPLEAALMALPRPNQAFWALSALWAGWLWGQEAAAPFKSVLRRRRYDWGWHTAALHASLGSLGAVLKPGAPILGLMGEAEPGLMSAALGAGALSGLALEGVALCAELEQAQVHWRAAGAAVAVPEGSEAAAQVAQAGHAYLQGRGQPTPYLNLHTAALMALVRPAESGGEPRREDTDAPTPAETYQRLQAALGQGLTFRRGFLRYGGSQHSPEVGLWGHAAAGDAAPLFDRVERTVVRALQRGVERVALTAAVQEEFAGLLTPAPAWIEAALTSYGQEQGGRWHLRAEDRPKARRAELEEVAASLRRLGERLGWQVQAAGDALVWQAAEGKAAYRFYVLASALASKVVLGGAGSEASLPAGERPSEGRPSEGRPSEGRAVLVVPGGRAGLLAAKLTADPRLKAALEADWSLLKFRQLRRLEADPNLTQAAFDAALNHDGLGQPDAQQLALPLE